jgi:hypothetical protein
MHLKTFISEIDKVLKTDCSKVADKGIIFFIMLFWVVPQTSAAEALGAAIDCSTVEIKYTDNPEWTDNERLEAMDKAFFESVNRFELCNLSNKSNALSGSADEMSQALNSGNGTESGSSKSSAITGTGTEAGAEGSSNTANNNVSQPEKRDRESTEKKGGGTKNGANPKDIPNANNDDVIASQIRLAAEIEQDPVKKQKLWNEYRKYKGLAIQ